MIKEWIAKHWCLHKWKIMHKVNLIDETKKTKTPYGYKYTYCCEKCGEWKMLQT